MDEEIMKTTLNRQAQWVANIHDITPELDKTYEHFEEYYQSYIKEGFTSAQAQTLAWEKCESNHGTGPVVKK